MAGEASINNIRQPGAKQFRRDKPSVHPAQPRTRAVSFMPPSTPSRRRDRPQTAPLSTQAGNLSNLGPAIPHRRGNHLAIRRALMDWISPVTARSRLQAEGTPKWKRSTGGGQPPYRVEDRCWPPAPTRRWSTAPGSSASAPSSDRTYFPVIMALDLGRTTYQLLFALDGVAPNANPGRSV